jgi:DNA-binding MarR family transcriptional regulator
MILVLQVLATAQAVTKAGQRLFRPHGLTVAKFNVLNLLSDQPDGMRSSDLARRLIVDASNVTGLVKRMKAEGYLREVDNVLDRRQHVVALSPKGLRIWKAAFQDYRRTLEAFEAGLNPADRRAAERVLQQILTASLSTH